MSTLSSVIPWKELAGMLSILMLSAISLHRPDTNERPFASFIDLKKRIVRVYEKETWRDPVGGFGGSVGGRVTPGERLSAKTTGIFASTVNAP